MFGNQNNAVLSDPKISTLMALIDPEGEKDETESKNEIPHPPITYEEFLKVEKIDEWPQRLTSEGHFDGDEILELLWSKDEVMRDLMDGAPLPIGIFDEFEGRMFEFGENLEAFSAYILSNQRLPSKFRDNLFHAPSEEFLDHAKESDAVVLHHSRRKKPTDTKLSFANDMIASRSHRIEYVNFPGYRPNELIELPSQLEAPQLLNRVTEAHGFTRGFYTMWKKIFLSEASIALLHDTFWWIFLENFEHNSHAQDKLYTRIASNYVLLFMNIHPDMRDKIFRQFPSCFAQCIYLTFREAFPESLDRLTEDFMSDVADTVYEWMTGVKCPIGSWKKWPWHRLCPPPGVTETRNVLQTKQADGTQNEPDMNFNINFDMLATLPRSPPPEDPNVKPPRIREISDEGQTKSIILSAKPTTVKTTAPQRPLPTKNTTKKESAPIGAGPDLERVLFSTSGRTPLVAHYLRMRRLQEESYEGKKMKRTEILQLPQSSETFDDVIKQSTETIRNIQKKQQEMTRVMDAEHRAQENYRKRLVIDTRRMQEALTDPVDIRIRCERVLDQAFERGLHRPSTYGGVPLAPSDKLESLLKEDDDVLPKEDQL